MTKMKNKPDKIFDGGRRGVLKKTGTAALASLAATQLPTHWQRPVINAVVLPAHAHTSPSGPSGLSAGVLDNPTGGPIPTPTVIVVTAPMGRMFVSNGVPGSAFTFVDSNGMRQQQASSIEIRGNTIGLQFMPTIADTMGGMLRYVAPEMGDVLEYDDMSPVGNFELPVTLLEGDPDLSIPNDPTEPPEIEGSIDDMDRIVLSFPAPDIPALGMPAALDPLQMPSPDVFTVAVSGVGVLRTVSSYEIGMPSPRDIRLTVAPALTGLTSGQTVTVTYTFPRITDVSLLPITDEALLPTVLRFDDNEDGLGTPLGDFETTITIE